MPTARPVARTLAASTHGRNQSVNQCATVCAGAPAVAGTAGARIGALATVGFVTTRLVLLTGPIASGKTTIARDLAARARSRGVGAASIDMDDLVFMINGLDWRTVTAAHWALARKAAAALIDALFSAGLDFVAVAGPFFGQSERNELIANVRTRASVHVVALNVALQQAITRAQADPSRTLSKDPALLAKLEKTINWAELPADAIRLSTDGLLAHEAGARIFRQLFDTA